MALTTIRDALNAALDEELARDKQVILLGEEVAQYNGAYKVSKGLLDKYGPERIVDTPITELGFTGIAVGAAMHGGIRPIVEWMTMQFGFLAIDQLISNAAKIRYMSGGQFSFPMVVRGCNGPAEYLAGQHSQSLASFFVHVPGIKVVAYSDAYSAKGLLKSAIRDNDLVVFLESEMTYGHQTEVPEEEYLLPLGKANVAKVGTDVTLISFSKPILMIKDAVKELEKQGISCEIVDLWSLNPLDEETIYKSVRKTGRCVVVDEDVPKCSVGSWVASLVSSNCFDDLDAPVELITSMDTPIPFNHKLELEAQPTIKKIMHAVKKVMYLED